LSFLRSHIAASDLEWDVQLGARGVHNFAESPKRTHVSEGLYIPSDPAKICPSDVNILTTSNLLLIRLYDDISSSIS